MGLAILAWLVLLYLFSSKPGWFARLLVSILIAGCGRARAPSANGGRGSLRLDVNSKRISPC